MITYANYQEALAAVIEKIEQQKEFAQINGFYKEQMKLEELIEDVKHYAEEI